jgi:hypothetical protein
MRRMGIAEESAIVLLGISSGRMQHAALRV